MNKPGPYVPKVPVLQVRPYLQDCEVTAVDGSKSTQQCVTLLARDLAAYIIELQGACLALGNSQETCGIK